MLFCFKINKKSLLLLFFGFCPSFSFFVNAHDLLNVQFAVSGRVVDSNGVPLGGTSVVEKGTTNGTQSDFDGNFSLSLNFKDAVLVFSFVGFVTQEISLNGASNLSIVLEEDTSDLDEIVLVGFGSQKKEAVVGAMTSIKPDELKIPASNLTTALAGRISGIISFQTSGEPGQDNAQFFVRGIASFNDQNYPLILIDGVELTVEDLARLQPDDIHSFSVLKDPTTTAIYGARGANGIILVSTKEGVEGRTRVNLRIENALNVPFSTVELADPFVHMQLQNEAERTRGEFPAFTEDQLTGTARGGNPNIYPAVDWFEELFQDSAITRRANLNVTGGGKKVRYYVAGAYSVDNGLLRVDKTNNFNNNISSQRYLLRSNINVDLHENTEMIVRIHATIDDYRGPLHGGNAIYNAAVRTSPVRFLPVLEPDESLVGIPHITFGNDMGPRLGDSRNNRAVWFNPYAELQRGYRDYRRQLSLAQLEFKQDLSSILKGLKVRFLGNANTVSSFENRRSYIPSFYRVLRFDSVTDEYELIRTSNGNESLNLVPGDTENNSVLYMETAIDYFNTFSKKHTVSGLFIFTAREFLDGDATTLELSLPSRNLTVAGRYSYDYDNRYFVEFNFGYNGSERFAKKNRFGFFPSIGVGWLVSSERLFSSKFVSRLKLRASHGIVGNDQIGNTRSDRFFYLSEVNIDDGSTGYGFGSLLNQYINGISISRYSNPMVTWETATKTNLGIEVNWLNDAFQFRLDAFAEKRENILQSRVDIPSTFGLQTSLKTNVGVVNAWGLDSSLDVNYSINNDTWVTARSNFVFSDNEYTVFEEPDYNRQEAPWRSNIGSNVTFHRGLVAERLFVDDEEALNSPTQFGTPGIDYGGGDIKYKDLNNDGVITDLDRIPMGKPDIPKITYGFGFSFGYKSFDFSIFFQGLAETSFLINPTNVGPFINVGSGINVISGNGTLTENGLLQAFADNHWSEENQDVYALWPRLSTDIVINNVGNSTWWLRDGSFLRLKQMEIGLDFQKLVENFVEVNQFRIYFSGTNLFTWSKFKLWDPELGGNGLNYPLQKVFNFGVHMGF